MHNIEFYTFFLGLRQAELESLRELLESFPHFDTHRIKVVDLSRAVKERIESGEEKFYSEERSYQINPVCDLVSDNLERLFTDYSDRVERIMEPEVLLHGQAIDKVMNEYASSNYVVIMDSDIVFTSKSFLADMEEFCKKYKTDELAAIGSIYQQRPFHLSMSREVDPFFYHFFMPDLTERVPWWRVLLTSGKNFLMKPRRPVKREYLGRFPRFHPALLLINRKMFTEDQMTFRNMYLDVLDARDALETNQKVFGDNGSSFLFQCALAGKQVVIFDLEDYALHKSNISACAPCEKTGWSWTSFDGPYQGRGV